MLLRATPLAVSPTAQVLKATAHNLKTVISASSQRFFTHPSASPSRRRQTAAARQTVTRAMLLECLPALEGKRIVLASASPRRKDLLAMMGLKFEVVPSSFEEMLPKEQYNAADYARHTASCKALDVTRLLTAQAAAAAVGGGGSEATAGAAGEAAGGAAATAVVAAGPPLIVIGADTVVEYGDHILEKPADADEAARVLRMLSGKQHHVHTGVALVLQPAQDGNGGAAGEPQLHSFSVTTSVEFDSLSEETIAAYIASGEPFDKAGSYGIQGLAGSFVRGIDGCFFNVVGFPVHRFGVELGQLIQSGALRL